MKKILKTVMISLIITILAFPQVTLAATEVYVTPAAHTVEVNSMFSIPIILYDVTDFRFANFIVEFDSNEIIFLGADLGALVSASCSGATFAATEDTPGTVSVSIDIGACGYISGDGVLTTLNFFSGANVGFTDLLLTDPGNMLLGGDLLDFIPVTWSDASVTIEDNSTEPVPVTLTPSDTTVTVGDTYSVTLAFTDGVDVGGVQTTFEYDSSILIYDNSTAQATFADIGGTFVVDDSAVDFSGTDEIAINAFAPAPINGDSLVGVFNFLAIGTGTGGITQTEETLTDSSFTTPISATWADTSLTVIDLDIDAPVITLAGNDPVELTIGDTYTDAGATALDNVDGDITASIVTTNLVDTSTVGNYLVMYEVSDAASNNATPVIRTVNVNADVDAPVITMLGSDPVELTIGDTYTDAGATALDNVDGDLTASIVTTNLVDINTIGSHVVMYEVSDSSSNSANPVIRTVNVNADTDAPVITMLGNDPIELTIGDTYTDAGATALDNVDGDLTASIVTTNLVDTSTIGNYVVMYEVSDAASNDATPVIRTVNVNADTDAPVITMLGSDPVELTIGDTYTDAGATALDNVDGDLTASIVTTNLVDINTIGVHVVMYEVSDNAGNSANPVIRTVNVNADTDAPVIFDESPSSALSSNTKSTTISLTTDEQAQCRYSSDASIAFENMTGVFTTGTTTDHSSESISVSNNQTYNYYVRCQDESGNTNIDDYLINFSVLKKTSSGGGSPRPRPTETPASTVYEEKPSLVSTERTEESVTLIWANPESNEYKETVIIRLTEEISTYYTYETLSALGDLVYRGSDETFVDTNTNQNTTYYYHIFTMNNENEYSDSVTIRKNPFGQSTDTEEEVKGVDAVKTGGYKYGDYKNLANVESSIVEMVSYDEGFEVYSHNSNVDLSDVTRNLYVIITSKSTKDLSPENRQSIAFFIHEGTPTTHVLGAGERAGVVSSYHSAFGELPNNTEDWKDIVKIANGRWPEKRNLEKENQAETTFFNSIFKRNPDMNNPHDNAAVTVITYGLRPADRNMDSEKTAINIFRAIFSHDPSTAIDWDIVRAIAYSGATR